MWPVRMGNGDRGEGFRNQYARMLRWFERFRRITEGQEHTVNVDCHEDTMRAFFENCYHLKDWVANDQTSRISREEVEGFIDHTPCVRLCADIANGNKHLALTHKPRSGKNPTHGPRHFTLSPGDGLPLGQVNYAINTEGDSLDAFHLVKDRVEAWKAFLETHGAQLIASRPEA